ncbi:NAD(P)-binding protein [Candidatus Dependentiae bacterium]|nr:NAD(P)-binding protein [Candidatus Dependentiae bacterium]
MAEVIILGAGLTGLSVAYHLEQKKIYDFEIFEKESIPGGLLRSFYKNGFIFDFTGHLLHINNDYFYNFINQIANIENFDLISRNSYIQFDGKFIPYPFQMNLGHICKDKIVDSIYGFINRKKYIKNPNNFHEWVLKHFGSGMGKYFFFPYNKKLLCYNTKKITASWTNRFVPKTNLKTILNCAVDKNIQQSVGYNNFFYYPKKDGIFFLIKQLGKKLQNKINLNHKMVKIDSRNKIIHFENGIQKNFKILISTIPLDTFLKNLKEDASNNLSKNYNKLLCNSVVNFNLGFNVHNLTNKHWIYFPQKNVPFYRIGFWHNICKNSTPKNKTAIYGELSYLQQKTSNEKLENLKNNSIEKILNILKLKHTNIITQKTLLLKHAYVIYDFWREKNLNKIHKALNNQSIYSIGRYGEWKYSSMQEAVLDGKKYADIISSKLTQNLNTTLQPFFLKKENTKEKLYNIKT